MDVDEGMEGMKKFGESRKWRPLWINKRLAVGRGVRERDAVPTPASCVLSPKEFTLERTKRNDSHKIF